MFAECLLCNLLQNFPLHDCQGVRSEVPWLPLLNIGLLCHLSVFLQQVNKKTVTGRQMQFCGANSSFSGKEKCEGPKKNDILKRWKREEGKLENNRE